MPRQSVTDTARSVVEAFNSADWKRLETALTADSVYSLALLQELGVM